MITAALLAAPGKPLPAHVLNPSLAMHTAFGAGFEHEAGLLCTYTCAHTHMRAHT